MYTLITAPNAAIAGEPAAKRKKKANVKAKPNDVTPSSTGGVASFSKKKGNKYLFMEFQYIVILVSFHFKVCVKIAFLVE